MSAYSGTIPTHGCRIKHDTAAGGIGFAVYQQNGNCSELSFGKNGFQHAIFTNGDGWALCDLVLECDTTSNPNRGASVDVYIYSLDALGNVDADEATVASDGTINGRGRLLCSTLLDSGKTGKHVHLMRDVPIPEGKFILTIMPIGCTVKSNAWLTMRRKGVSIV